MNLPKLLINNIAAFIFVTQNMSDCYEHMMIKTDGLNHGLNLEIKRLWKNEAMEVDSLKVLMKNEVKDGKMYYSIYTAIPFEQIAEKLNEMFKCEDEGSISEKIWRV
jgi:hypothetical protein